MIDHTYGDLMALINYAFIITSKYLCTQTVTLLRLTLPSTPYELTGEISLYDHWI